MFDLPGSGIMVATSACVSCGGLFTYDPDRVPSVRVKAGTGRRSGQPAEYDPEGPREPICPSCAKAANPERRRRGLEPCYEGDTAQDLASGHPRPV